MPVVVAFDTQRSIAKPQRRMHPHTAPKVRSFSDTHQPLETALPPRLTMQGRQSAPPDATLPCGQTATARGGQRGPSAAPRTAHGRARTPCRWCRPAPAHSSTPSGGRSRLASHCTESGSMTAALQRSPPLVAPSARAAGIPVLPRSTDRRTDLQAPGVVSPAEAEVAATLAPAERANSHRRRVL